MYKCSRCGQYYIPGYLACQCEAVARRCRVDVAALSHSTKYRTTGTRRGATKPVTGTVPPPGELLSSLSDASIVGNGTGDGVTVRQGD